jgi:hypothetical protein
VPKLDKYEKAICLIFLITLPLANPWVRGDGVGYYAYVRSLLIERNLNFEKDWQHGNESFVMSRIDNDGRVLPQEYTNTGHINNHWSIGPSILWAPFLLVTHLGVLLCNHLGAHISADGFSTPYLKAMALGTAIYGWLGLWLSYLFAREYFGDRSAFLATLGIWWASSLPVYMYFNPSWSHAHSAFADALFLWYWNRTRRDRTILQWVTLGLLSGLIVNVYYPNGMLLLVPLMEALTEYWKNWRLAHRDDRVLIRHLARHVIYLAAFLVALLPTLISREIIFGNPLRSGYQVENFVWKSPALWNVLFSWDHGLLSWTPILVLALIGLGIFCHRDRALGLYLLMAFVAFYYIVSVQPTWDGMSSFGSRYFVSLTPLFVFGLASLFEWLGRVWRVRPAQILAACTTLLFVVWNIGLIFQWGTHLIPSRGPISWRDAAYNQVAVVPFEAKKTLEAYLTKRKLLMGRIEQQDIDHLKSDESKGTPPSR